MWGLDLTFFFLIFIVIQLQLYAFSPHRGFDFFFPTCLYLSCWNFGKPSRSPLAITVLKPLKVSCSPDLCGSVG